MDPSEISFENVQIFSKFGENIPKIQPLSNIPIKAYFNVWKLHPFDAIYTLSTQIPNKPAKFLVNFRISGYMSISRVIFQKSPLNPRNSRSTGKFRGHFRSSWCHSKILSKFRKISRKPKNFLRPAPILETLP